MNRTRIVDLLTFKNVEEYYQIYKDSQWFDDADMKDYQLGKFRKLISHCYNGVPYYRQFMDSIGLHPKDIESIEQIKVFPIITKEIIKENYNAFIPTNINSIRGVKISQTGGTTGNILFNRNDSSTRSSVWATYKRFEDWMGITPKDRKLILMGGHVLGVKIYDKLKNGIFEALTNTRSFGIYQTSQENVQQILNALKSDSFSLIRSYSQFLYYLASLLEKEGIVLNVKAITTTAEPLLPSQRELFKKVFNSPVFDQYGCGEIGGIAYECPEHTGLHTAEERVILEVNDNQELIITDLDNFAMPFIRYWNADQAIFSQDNCKCGRNGKIITEIKGRTCDYISGINGEFLHWAYFWHLIFDSSVAEKRKLMKFQIVQESFDHLIIRLVSEKLTVAEENNLIRNIRERLGDMNIQFLYEGDIENTKTGKYRPVVNKLLVK